MENRSVCIAVCIFSLTALTACPQSDKPDVKGDEPPLAVLSSAPAKENAASFAYRDALHTPAPGWTGPVFKLSHDYPIDAGTCSIDECTWLAMPISFTTDYTDGWADYMNAILDYVKQGQNLEPSGWNVKVDGATRWYHVPWMAFSESSGREFIHGMTNERTAKLSDLHDEPHGLAAVSDSENGFETWAFGVYNSYGGAAFGNTWKKDGTPMMKGQCDKKPFKDCLPAGLPFPEGTLVAKLLFTTATPESVSYLKNSPTWTVNRHTKDGCTRAPQAVHLVQMDVAVVDERSPSRWVYGTFGYNGTLDGAVWERMSSLGVQWGSDPGAFPGEPDKNKTIIKETALASINIYEHYGCGGRLAGPVDNKLASCVSCHGNAYAAAPAGTLNTMGINVPPIYGFPGICTTYNENNAEYYSNKSLGETWPQFANVFPLDTSLQMMVAFTSYAVWNTNGKANACKAK